MKVIYSSESKDFLYSCPTEEVLEFWISEIKNLKKNPYNPRRSKQLTKPGGDFTGYMTWYPLHDLLRRYRIIYSIRKETPYIRRIGHRSIVYDKKKKMLCR